MKRKKIYSYLQRSLLKVLRSSINSNQNQTLLTRSPLTILSLGKLKLTPHLTNTLYKKKRLGFSCKFFLISKSALQVNQDQSINEKKFDYSFTRIHQLFHFSFSRRSFFDPSSVYISRIIIVRDAKFWKRRFFTNSISSSLFSYLKNNFDFIEKREFLSKQQKKNKERIIVLFYYKKTYCDSLNKKFLNSRKGFYHLHCFFSVNKENYFINNSFSKETFLDIFFYALIKTKKAFEKGNLTFSNLYQFNELNLNKLISLKSFSQKIIITNKTNSSYFYLMRPFFSLTRLDTFYICETLQLPIYPDQSNLRVDFLRNRVRKQILPAIRILLNPQFDTLLCKFNDSE